MRKFLNSSLLRSASAATVGLCLALALAYAQDDKPIRVGGNVQQANRISLVTPVYPAEAKQKRIEGTVKLEVLIGKDGHVAQITPVSGPAELIQSATDAVLGWVYKPTLLNGEPVNVLTTVDVNYTLAQ
jgi:protein TonB